MDTYRTVSTSYNSARLDEPIVLEVTGTTRKVLIVDLNDKKIDSGETVGITVAHQRKNQKDEWESVESTRLSSLKAGEIAKLSLDSKTTKILFDELSRLYALVEQEGVKLGTHKFSISKADEIVRVPNNRKIVIERLLADNYGEEIWSELQSNDPDLATRLSLARVQTTRAKALEEFEKNLKSNNDSEGYWQQFFLNNSWIFGYGLKYHFLSLIGDQPHYGGTDYTGKGTQRGDYLMCTEAEAKFTVLVEIKTPATNILATKKGEPHRYRNGAFLLSSDLLGGVSQMQINCKTWGKQSSSEENAEKLRPKEIYTVQPKGILVIGNLSSLGGNREKLETFEAFRRHLSNPEILTYDELFERAKFIVNSQANEVIESNEISEDVLEPF